MARACIIVSATSSVVYELVSMCVFDEFPKKDILRNKSSLYLMT